MISGYVNSIIEMTKNTPNRCSYCCRFKSWDDLYPNYTPDTSFSSEEIFFVCRECRDKS